VLIRVNSPYRNKRKDRLKLEGGFIVGRLEIRRFQGAADEAASSLKQKLNPDTHVKIISHTDADGVSAAGILAQYFHKYNVPFDTTFTRPLEPSEVAELAKGDYDLFVFIDQGTGQMPAIHRYLLEAGRDVVILDHHSGEFSDHPNLTLLNPHACGLNGAKDVSASGVVYSVVERMDESFRPLAWQALVGALGDREEFFSGFTGMNELFLRQAIDLDVVEVGEGFRLIGRDLYPVVECLRLSIRPYLQGLTENSEACRELTETLGISSEETLSQLGRDREVSLRDALLARSGAVASEVFRHVLWGSLYIPKVKWTDGPQDMHGYIAMLDACDKLGKPSVGFAAFLGDKSAVTDALAILRKYQERMASILHWFEVNRERFKTSPQMRYIYADKEVNPHMIGEAISLAIESGLVEADRPVIGLVDSGDELKVSARATPRYAMEGGTLGEALRRAASDLGGSGGGHDAAAAARIPLTRKDEFIAKLNQGLAQGHND
jgi:RecJ-like exonuclease